MRYHELILHHITLSGMSIQKITDKLKMHGIEVDRSYVSMLKNGRTKNPASDEINSALEIVLGIKEYRLRIAAVKEKLGFELFQIITKNADKEEGVSDGKAS